MQIINVPEQLTVIHNHGNSVIYKFMDAGRNYILKVLPGDHPDLKQVAQFNMEYELTHQLDVPGIRRALSQIKHKDHFALILEYIDGETIRNKTGKKWPLDEFLPLAISLADTLGRLHLKKVVHKDVNSNNILLENVTGAVKIIDFGLATSLTEEMQQMHNPDQLDGTLHYISPEQTGRMNRTIDYRTDLYSLGVVFYELLAGDRPFDSKDPIELVHQHIALPPDLGPIPAPLDGIVGKLLAKNAEDRYQSAFGLKHDLEQCLRDWSNYGQLRAFELALHDHSQRFRIPQKLYGRDQEITQLMDDFELARTSENRLFLIAGYSGIGKSALVNEVHKPITARKGYFISGKYDQFQRNVPYFAFIRAFEALTEQLLTESTDRLQAWKQNIERAVGKNGQVLAEVIPAIEHIIGPQKPVPPLPPAESQNRFTLTFLNFIKVFAKPDHPLVIFIDDLQWADLASLRLIENLLLDEEAQNLLVIGAYRDNEVDAAHPLMRSLNDLEKQTARISSITLSPLNQAQVNELVSDTLNREPADCNGLSNLIFEKTNGNPFFVTQFFRKLHDDGYISYDPERYRWNWQIEEIRDLNITDNVVDLMAQKIRQLPEETVEMLKLAACVGDTFDLRTLAAISEKSPYEVASILWTSMVEGLTPSVDDKYKKFQLQELASQEDIGNAEYRFLHDRIQQAAYSLIPSDELQELHLRIGRLLLTNTREEKLEELLFDIANHLNQGIDLINSAEERQQYAEINVSAGKKAKTSTAYTSALSYLYSGIRLLHHNAWEIETQYRLAFDLHINAAECEYLANNLEKARELLDILVAKSTSIVDKAQVYVLRGVIAQNIGEIQHSLDEYSEGLKLFEVLIPAEVTPEMIGAGIHRIETLRAGRPIADLVDLPEMKDQEKYFVLLLMLNCATPAFFMDKNLWTWIILEAIATILEHGNADVSEVFYGPYGLLVGQALGDFKSGYEWGKVGFDLNQRSDIMFNRAKVNVVFGNMVSHWQKHLRHNAEYAQEGFEAGVETGDLIYAGICLYHLPHTMFLLGRPLQEVYEENAKCIEFLVKTKDIHHEANQILNQSILALQGKTESPLTLESPGYNVAEKEELLSKMANQMPYHVFRCARLRIRYLGGDIGGAVAAGNSALELTEASLGMQIVPEQFFYHGLAIIAQSHELPETDREPLLSVLDTILGQMGKWAEAAPMNYQHKHLLLQTERQRLSDPEAALGEKYDEVIELAKTHHFVQDEALANELAGRYWNGRGKEKFAKVYLADALYLFSVWGATIKVRALQNEFPELLASRDIVGAQTDSLLNTVTGSSSGSSLDLQSILKAGIAISSEVVLENLLKKLLQIILENAGAEHCYLTRPSGKGDWLIQGAGSINQPLQVLQREPVKGSGKISEAVLQYVARTKDSVVLNDAVNNHRFGNTEYIQQYRPKSILCTPIINQGKMEGIIYLENNLTTGAFPEYRIQLLKLLSGQIAVSIENAILYESLEFKVRERTATIEQQNQEIALEKKKSDDLLLNILPPATAEELKESGEAVPKSYEQVSVLFTDFKGFTTISERLSPQEIIAELNECFSAFDDIIERHNLEKIKTIGDAYMCAGGLPIANRTNPVDAVRAGLEIQHFMREWNAKRIAERKDPWELRVGIHTGRVIAGVVGQKKFAYDIWGDAVNIASRMESHSEEGKVNISQDTYDLVHAHFNCLHRGKVFAKHKGEIDMYFVLNENE